MGKISEVIKKTQGALFLLLIVMIFALNKFTVGKIMAPSYVTMLMAIGVVFIIRIVSFDYNPSKSLNSLVIFCLFFILQVFLCINISFRTSWDSQAVLYSARFAAIQDSVGMKDMSSYLSIYPSNIFLVWIYSVVFYWNECVLHITNDTLNLIQVMQCAISSLAAIITYKSTQKLTGNEGMSRVALVLYILVTGITGWLVIPYSDSTGLFLPVLLFYLVILYYEQNNFSGKVFVLFLIGFLTYSSYRIKPEIIIVVIAFAIISIIKTILNRKFEVASLFFAIGIAMAVICVNLAVDSMGYDLDSEAEFGWQHYIMQGVNVQANGGNSDSDLAFSQSIATKKDRDAKNLQVARERLQEMGFVGYLKLACIKIYRPFSSGTMGFGGIGKSFYHETYSPKLGKITKILRSVFWEEEICAEVNDGISYFRYYSFFKQIIWNVVIVLAMLASLTPKKLSDPKMVLYLSVIGIFPYFVLLESHPRYMLVQTPLLIIMAVIGFERIVRKKKENDICSNTMGREIQ